MASQHRSSNQPDRPWRLSNLLPRPLPSPFLLVLLGLPWLLLAFNSNWIFTPLTTVDPWVYFGYFLNLPLFKADWFPHTYFGSRLPWILPGYLVHRAFDVVTAHLILHLGMYYLAVFCFYWLLKQEAGPRNALLATVVFACHPAFLIPAGWDYVDGPGLTYNLVGLTCAVRASRSRSAGWWLITAVRLKLE